jgi:hypothetical protein
MRRLKRYNISLFWKIAGILSHVLNIKIFVAVRCDVNCQLCYCNLTNNQAGKYTSLKGTMQKGLRLSDTVGKLFVKDMGE